MKNLLKRVLALAGVGALLSTALVVGIAAPASAHTGDLKVTAVCNTTTGKYDFTATLRTANTGEPGTTQFRVGTEHFDGTPSNADGMSGDIKTTGAQTVTLTTFSLPGTTTGYGPWVYAFTTWGDGYKQGSDGQLRQPLGGDCTIPVTPLPADKGIDCTTAFLAPGRALTNGDHININVLINGKTEQRNAYVDRNIAGGYDTLGLRINTGSGEVTQPLTEEAVKTGKFSFNFGQYVTGYYEVQWAQFNNTYFNQANNPADYIKCGTPPEVPVSVTWNLVPTAPDCDTAGALPALPTVTGVTFAWDRPFDGAGTYTATATAASGYVLTGPTTQAVTVAPATGFQNTDATAPCYVEPPVITPTVTVTEVVDCDTSTVLITTTTTTPTFTFDSVTGLYTEGAPTVTVEETTREATVEECPLPPVVPPVENCDDFLTQEQAQNAFDSDPVRYAGLDADGDGIACETGTIVGPPTTPEAVVRASTLPATGGEAGVWILTGLMGLGVLGVGTALLVRNRRKA